MLVAVLVGSFVLTLWQIDTKISSPDTTDSRSASERLANQHVPKYADLSQAMDAVGLKRSVQMNGNVDGIIRINDREVMITGWLADLDGDATPLNVVVFVSGPVAATTQTKGERSDVTRLMGLAFGAEKNVGFEVKVSCPIGNQPVVVGLGTNKRYFPLISPPCS
jgi:hypothetical protein